MHSNDLNLLSSIWTFYNAQRNGFSSLQYSHHFLSLP